MASNKDSVSNTILVALVLCIVCSVIVAGAAVSLKPIQAANKKLDRNRNILAAAGMFKDGEPSRAEIAEQFARFEVRAVNLDTGNFATDEELAAAGIDLKTYDQRSASRNPALSAALDDHDDIASIKRRARYALTYVLRDGQDIDRIVLPIHGYGLWGTLYGFMAVDGDGQTVRGLGFYEHKETPGLGAEVDNPKWKAQWPGKQIYYDSGEVALRIVKGKVDASSGATLVQHSVDGLSGATLTSRGVQNMLQFWFGEQGFGPFLAKLREGRS